MGKRIYNFDIAMKSRRVGPAFDRMKLLTNIITNGDFANTTGWAATACGLSVADGILTVTNNGTQAYGIVTFDTAVLSVIGKKIYLSCQLRVTNAVCSYAMLIVDAKSAGTNQEVLYASPTQDLWYATSVVKTQPADINGVVQLKVVNNYANAGTSSGKILQIKNVVMIDLTSHYGAGNEPSAAQMDTMLASMPNKFFSGSRIFTG